MHQRTIIILSLITLHTMAQADLVITGYYDGEFTSDSTSRGMEFYATRDLTLGNYEIQTEWNGESDGVAEWYTTVTTWGTDGGLDSTDTLVAGSFLYLFDSLDAKNLFANEVGDPEYWTTHNNLKGNGNDAFRIVRENDSIVVDQLGDPSDTTLWEHEHDYLYRKDLTGPNSGTFDAGNWAISSGDAMSGANTVLRNFPAGTYIYNSIPESAGALLFLAFLLFMLKSKRAK